MRIQESELTGHIIELRERVAAMQSEVSHLAQGQSVHSGSLVRTDQRLAHIAQSLAEAHLLIAIIQRDVEEIASKPEPTSLDLQTLAPALAGLVILLLVAVGRGDLASKLVSLGH